MKNKLLKRVVTLTIVGVTFLTSLPIGISAEWKQDSNGWWNTEGSSYSVGWRKIDGQWYYFDINGYMAKNTIVDGCILGSDGIWIQNDNINVNTYTKGQAWTVDNQWEFTINSVTVTSERNQFSDDNPEQVIYINYSYKNLGYVDDIQNLFFSDFTVMDELGDFAELYPISNALHFPEPIQVGAECSNAMIAYGLKNKSSQVTIQVEKYRRDIRYTKEKAIYTVQVEE